MSDFNKGDRVYHGHYGPGTYVSDDGNYFAYANFDMAETGPTLVRKINLTLIRGKDKLTEGTKVRGWSTYGMNVEGTLKNLCGKGYVERPDGSLFPVDKVPNLYPVDPPKPPKEDVRIGTVVNPNHYGTPGFDHSGRQRLGNFNEPPVGTILVMTGVSVHDSPRTAVLSQRRSWNGKKYVLSNRWVVTHPTSVGLVHDSGNERDAKNSSGITHYYYDTMAGVVNGDNSGPWTVVYLP